MEDSLIKRMISSIKCGSCGQHYEEASVEVVEHKREIWLLRVFCSSCHVRCVVAAIIKEDKKPKIVSDLTEAELKKFKGISRIKVDDMLDMHNYLKDLEGELPRLVRRTPK
jgi:hypothetical protein